MDPTSAEDGGGLFENSTASTVLWICAAVFFLCCPLLANSSRRKLCAARIRQRRWNATDQNRDWYREAAERLEERSRHRRDNGQPASLTMEEEEEIRQLFLIQELSQYTMTISSDDIKVRTNVEKTVSGDTASDSSDASMDEKVDIETGNNVQKPAGKSLEDDEDTDSDGDHDLIVNEFEHSDRIVTVIAAGESVLPLDHTHKTREVANGCAICLCEFDSRDQVTWAANKECPHVFHSDCILQWMLALGRKEQKRRRHYPERSTGDPLKDVVTFPMLCPCCRQQFINKPEDIPSLTPEPSSSLSEADSTEEVPPETNSTEDVPSETNSTSEEPQTATATQRQVMENDTSQALADNV